MEIEGWNWSELYSEGEKQTVFLNDRKHSKCRMGYEKNYIKDRTNFKAALILVYEFRRGNIWHLHWSMYLHAEMVIQAVLIKRWSGVSF